MKEEALSTGISILLLASGFARRMRGADKVLMPVDGQALLRGLAEAALDVSRDVSVTLPVPGGARSEALAGLPVRQVAVPDADEGMAAAIRAGTRALPSGAAAVMIVPADMPEFEASDLAAIARAFDPARPEILRGAAEDGTPGHPVLFPQDCFDALSGLHGDTGAKPVLRAEAGRVRHVSLPAQRAVTDLDTPEDWAAWRARTGR